MKIDFISAAEFDAFATTHEYRSYFQTSLYGELMKKEGFHIFYVGLKNDKTLIAATLIIYNKIWGKYRYGYAPRGFLVNYDNINDLKTFTNALKKFLKTQNFVYIKLDPPAIYKRCDKNGNLLNNENAGIIALNNLKSLGYVHMGFNPSFERIKARNNSFLNINKTPADIFKDFDKSLKNKIRQSQKKGLVIQKGTEKDIETFYNFVTKKHVRRKLPYYKNFYELFNSKNMFDLYFAKIETHLYSQIANLYYKKYEVAQEKVDKKLKNPNIKNKTKLVKKKMEIDKQLDIWKNNVIESTKLLRSNPEGIIIGAIAVVKYTNTITFLISGFDKKFKNFNPHQFLRWKIIEEYSRAGFQRCDLNAISIDPSNQNIYKGLTSFILDFNGDVTEYIGEFDLIVNLPVYKLLQQKSAFKSFLNKNEGKMK